MASAPASDELFQKGAHVIPSEVVLITRDMLFTAILLAAPAVATSLVLGLIVSLIQTVTSIQEQTLSFVPRMLGVGLVLIITLPWTLKIATAFCFRMFEHAAGVGP